MSKCKSFDLSFKLKAVECARCTSKMAAAREFGVHAKRMSVVQPERRAHYVEEEGQE